MIRIARSALALLALLWLPSASLAQTHVALIIGNAAYEAAPALKTPHVDAEIVAETLRAAGYDVTELRDLRQAEIGQAMRDFLDKAANAGPEGVAFVYFSGHGARSRGASYLVPVDAVIGSDADVDNECFRVNDLYEALAATPLAARVVVLDASRDHKLGSRSAEPVQKGLATRDPVPGLVFAFAASPGMLARDGSGEYSLYTGTLVTAMRQPGADIEQVFKAARLQVHQASDGAQTPWSVSGLTVNVTLFSPEEEPVPPAAAEPMPAPPPAAKPPKPARTPQARRNERDRPPTDADNPTPAGRGPPPAIMIMPGLGGFGIELGR